MSKRKYVYETQDKILRYKFPTHINDIVIPREEASSSECFMVLIEKDGALPPHKHDDCEQIYYILDGEGRLEMRLDGEEDTEVFSIHPNQVVRIPPHTWHRVFALSDNGIKYFCVDCFPNGFDPAEPTCESHVKATVAQRGWDFEKIREDYR